MENRIEGKEHFHGSDLEKIEKYFGIPKESITGFGANAVSYTHLSSDACCTSASSGSVSTISCSSARRTMLFTCASSEIT